MSESRIEALIEFVIVIVISRFLKLYFKAKRTRAPAYSRALKEFHNLGPAVFTDIVIVQQFYFCWTGPVLPCTRFRGNERISGWWQRKEEAR